VVIVDATVAVAIKIGKVFDKFDPALLEHPEIEIRLHALDFPAESDRVCASNHCEAIAELIAALFCLLRDSKGRTILNARKSKLRRDRNGQRAIDEIVNAEVKTVDITRRKCARIVN